MIQQYCELNAFTATSTKSSDRVADGSGYGIGEAFNMTAFRSQRIVPKPNTNRNTTLLQHDMLSCSPSRALYNVTVTYRDGLRTITRSERYLGSIREKIVPLEIYDPKVPACDQLEAACYNQSASKEARVQPCALYDTCYEQQPADWPQPLRDTFTAFNDFALIDALISPLSGNYTMFPSETFVTGGSSHFTCGKLLAGQHLITMLR